MPTRGPSSRHSNEPPPEVQAHADALEQRGVDVVTAQWGCRRVPLTGEVARRRAQTILDSLPADGIYRHSGSCPCPSCCGAAVSRLLVLMAGPT